MPELLGFHLVNFKGAGQVDIEISRKTSAPVITLIGLNESGKTTILEGISHFVSVDQSVSPLFGGVHTRSAVTDLIPIHLKANFNGKISITADFKWEEADQKKLEELAEKHGLEVSTESLGPNFVVEKSYSFKDSVPDSDTNYWTLSLMTREKPKSKRNKPKPFAQYSRPEEGSPDYWLDVVRYLSLKIPKVVYFPTFLVDMPLRIYLQEHSDETSINRYYRSVIQDVLTSVDPELSIERHVVKRIKDFRAAETSPAWMALFFGTPSKSHIDSVFQKLASAITREVIGSWSKVFQRPSGARSVLVEWNVDTQKHDMPYVSFFVSDGESRYAVSERSLGFRWFFSFLLFTAFKQAASRPTLFLFDEPAANLHAKAQAELLKNFARIAAAGNKVVYSTHSHHMINPRWLSAAYIVENKSIDYDAAQNFELNSRPTEVAAVKYRNFVSQFPHRTSYFQPVTEKLEYVTPEIVGKSPYLIVEGITDFYAITYARMCSQTISPVLSVMPGTGAGASGPLLSYLLGRGETFFVLLDDDEAGERAKKRYCDDWFLTNQSVALLGDIDPKLSGCKLETIISEKSKQQIAAHFSRSNALNKKELGLLLAEMCSTDVESCLFDEETLTKFSGLIQKVEQRLMAA